MARSPRMEGYFSFDKGVVTETHILSGGEGSLMSMDNFNLSPRVGLERRKGAVLEDEVSITLTADNSLGKPINLPSIYITGQRVIELNNRIYGSTAPYERGLAISTNIGTVILLIDRGQYPLKEYLTLTPENLANKMDVNLTSYTYAANSSLFDGIGFKGALATTAVVVTQVVSGAGVTNSVSYPGYENNAATLRKKVSANQTKGQISHRYGDSVVGLDGVVVGTLGMGIGALLEDTIAFNNASILYRDFKIQSDINSDVELSKESDQIFKDQIMSDLTNQGWTKGQIESYLNRFGRYPALSMSPADAYDTDDDGKEYWNAAMFDTSRYQRSSGEMARGSRVLKQAHGARSDKDSIDDDSGLYLTCSEVHGGRVWYAGHRNLVFYSKSLMPSPKIRDLATCHSINDPTSRYDNDPLPTDGGYVSIPGGGNFICMRDFLGSLVVFGGNGVWSISGSDLTSVSDPADITVSAISNTGPLNQGSIIVADNAIYYFTKGGIHAIRPNEETGALSVSNISSDVFGSYYRSIPEEERRTAMGSYSEEYDRISWALVGTDGIRIINIDTRTGAMFPYSISNPNRYNKVIPYPDESVRTEAVNSTVVVGNDVVYVGLDEVDVPEGVDVIIVELSNPFRYLGVVENDNGGSITMDIEAFTLSGDSFKDWDEESYLSFVETSYDTWDSPATDKDVNTMFVWIDNTITEGLKELGMANLKMIDDFKIENYVQSLNASNYPNMYLEGLSYGGLAASGDIVDE